MNADRRLRLWNLVVEHAHGEPATVKHVCAAAIEATGTDCAAITVTLSASPRETLHASDRLASELEELALTLGEGPSVDALAGTPTLVADLTMPECLVRWPMYAPAAADAGARAVFALPLQVGAIRLGVLDLYRGSAGDLDRDQVADALMLADTACALLLDATDQNRPPPSGGRPEDASLQHPEVHQATGMITVQLGVTAAVALVRMRAYAYTNGRRLREVAGDVVARTLRFSADGDGSNRNPHRPRGDHGNGGHPDVGADNCG